MAGEEYIWNSAIEKSLPNLERVIIKKGDYFAHRLRHCKSEEGKFYVRIKLITHVALLI